MTSKLDIWAGLILEGYAIDDDRMIEKYRTKIESQSYDVVPELNEIGIVVGLWLFDRFGNKLQFS